MCRDLRGHATDGTFGRSVAAIEVPVTYMGVEVSCAYRMDMLVEKEVVVELKAVETLAPVHVSQVLSYLRLADLHVGLLFNFNVEALVGGGWTRILRTK